MEFLDRLLGREPYYKTIESLLCNTVLRFGLCKPEAYGALYRESLYLSSELKKMKYYKREIKPVMDVTIHGVPFIETMPHMLVYSIVASEGLGTREAMSVILQRHPQLAGWLACFAYDPEQPLRDVAKEQLEAFGIRVEGG